MKDMIPFLVRFFKAGRDAHVDQFIKGKLFMNRLAYFLDIERASDRTDRYEATAMWWQPSNLSIEFIDHPELNIGPQDLGGPVSMAFDYHRDLHIFCMSAMHAGEFDFIDGAFDCATDEDVRRLKKQLEFSDDCLALGDVAVVVNASEFMLRVKRAIEKRGYKFKATLVEYYDPKTYHGKFGFYDIPFRKRIEFSFQKEYRIVVDSGTKGDEPLEIELGDISDISGKMPAANLNNEFAIGPVK
jgi:hypothetical protein